MKDLLVAIPAVGSPHKESTDRSLEASSSTKDDTDGPPKGRDAMGLDSDSDEQGLAEMPVDKSKNASKGNAMRHVGQGQSSGPSHSRVWSSL